MKLLGSQADFIDLSSASYSSITLRLFVNILY